MTESACCVYTCMHVHTHVRTYVCVHLQVSKEVDTVRMYHEYVGGRGNGYQPLCRNTV